MEVYVYAEEKDETRKYVLEIIRPNRKNLSEGDLEFIAGDLIDLVPVNQPINFILPPNRSHALQLSKQEIGKIYGLMKSM